MELLAFAVIVAAIILVIGIGRSAGRLERAFGSTLTRELGGVNRGADEEGHDEDNDERPMGCGSTRVPVRHVGDSAPAPRSRRGAARKSTDPRDAGWTETMTRRWPCTVVAMLCCLLATILLGTTPVLAIDANTWRTLPEQGPPESLPEVRARRGALWG
jgi:hypothetical protein